MQPHPYFADQAIPATHQLDAFVLKKLTIKDLDRDYEAVMQSIDEIKAANPNSDWPSIAMTVEENMIDLAWHQKEFETRRSFAWVIEYINGTYLGCAYVFPSIAGKPEAQVSWWWKTGVTADNDRFHTLFIAWLAGGDWPELKFKLADMS